MSDGNKGNGGPAGASAITYHFGVGDPGPSCTPLNGWWSKADGSGEGGLIIDGLHLTAGETLIYQKLQKIEKMLADLGAERSKSA